MNYLAIMNRAREAANTAGDAWMKAHTQPAYIVTDNGRPVGAMLDLCGFAYVKLTDKRNGFAKWCKANGFGDHFIHFNHKYECRQEWGLKEACVDAALKVLREEGITKVTMYSRVD